MHHIHRGRIAFRAAHLLEGLYRPLGLALGTEHHDGDLFDHQARTFEFRLFGGQLPGGKKRFLRDAGKRSQPQMNRVDVHTSTPLRFFLGDF